MNKSPEQYFQEQAFDPKRDEPKENFSSAEQAFLEKYLGVEKKKVLGKLGIEPPAETVPQGEPAGAPVAPPEPAPVATVPVVAQAPDSSPVVPETSPEVAPEAVPEIVPEPVATSASEPASESASKSAFKVASKETGAAPATAEAEEEFVDMEESLKLEENLQLVGFFLGQQELTVPISMVQEVIRFVQPTKLPAAPDFLEGIVNLRGKVTPLIRLSSLLGMGGKQGEQEGFIVVCRHRGLQLGLITQTVASMYRVSGKDVEWGVESHLGVNVEYIIGLLKSEGKLIGVLSLDRIVEKILQH
jgi:purine-binding chemotaxis protein CheW